MAGIYVHIPFCKKICSYCDFYKTAVTSWLPGYIEAALKELTIRKDYAGNDPVETIYMGGGTPSLLSAKQAEALFNYINKIFPVSPGAEITMEANPDDLTAQYLSELKSATPVNRLSIGIQSFRDADLKLLNRRHNAVQALESIENARKAGFNNISIDLIYGIPGLGIEGWKYNLETLPETEHISAYHLTIEQGTALAGKVKSGLLSVIGEEESTSQFHMLQEYAANNGFIHYEISNLARQGFESRHNSNYWKHEKYIGIGPSAHSYDLVSRQWNIRDTKGYINALAHDDPFFEKEILGTNEKFNEYLMLSLRTIRGADVVTIMEEFGNDLQSHFTSAVKPFTESGHISVNGTIYNMTSAGWLISDYIVSSLMA